MSRTRVRFLRPRSRSPLIISKKTNRMHHVNWLILKKGELSHYCLIKDLNRFLSRIKSDGHKHYFCPYCLQGLTEERILNDHQPYCSTNGAKKAEFPIPGKNDILEFKDFEKQLRVPFVIYADFETINRKIPSCASDPKQCSTTPLTQMEVCGFGYKVVSVNPQYTKPSVIYRGQDASHKFIESLQKERLEIEKVLENIEPIQMSEEDETDFQKAIKCCICNRKFAHHEQRARHHHHTSGQYLGCSHMLCNNKLSSYMSCFMVLRTLIVIFYARVLVIFRMMKLKAFIGILRSISVFL